MAIMQKKPYPPKHNWFDIALLVIALVAIPIIWANVKPRPVVSVPAASPTPAEFTPAEIIRARITTARRAAILRDREAERERKKRLGLPLASK